VDGPQLSVVTATEAPSGEEIAALLDRAASGTGHAALSEHKLMTLRQALAHRDRGTGSEFVAAVVARSRPGGVLIGFAPVTGDRVTRRYALEVVAEPGSDSGGHDTGTGAGVGTDADADADLRDLVAGAAVDLVAQLGGGVLRWWSFEVSDDDDARAVARGFRAERSLIQMRCPLPLPHRGGDRHKGRSVATRPFRPGLDEEAWLATNNRAFATHPEQGGWGLATFLEREKESWFDPDGLLLLEEGGRLAGSCWTKIHRETDPPMGEIYVIGIDPDFHGRGWGRALTEAGLDWLAGQGLSLGMLYVDADNAAALSLYRSMGFVEDHVDRAYVIDIN
jgi:mycothiol synthase